LISNYDEIEKDAQMAAEEIFVEVDHPKYGRFRTVDSPFRVEGQRKVNPGPAPELGEHTREVLRSLGYSLEETREFLEKGIAFQK
jgi:crotonobetainyl-CoA:carnitine CoA-transferase CaiB-like acyl-CoA transferase